MSFSFLSFTRPLLALKPRLIPTSIARRMASTIQRPRDPNTLSNYVSWKTKHTIASFDVDFKAQKLTGNVVLQLASETNSESEEILLDTSFLDIHSVSLNGNSSAEWKLIDRMEPFGSPLSIKVPGGAPLGSIVSVDIGVSTTDKCTALRKLKSLIVWTVLS